MIVALQSGVNSRIQSSEQTVAALKQHAKYTKPIGCTEVANFSDINSTDISKIDFKKYDDNLLQIYQNKACELAEIFVITEK